MKKTYLEPFVQVYSFAINTIISVSDLDAAAKDEWGYDPDGDN